MCFVGFLTLREPSFFSSIPNLTLISFYLYTFPAAHGSRHSHSLMKTNIMKHPRLLNIAQFSLTFIAAMFIMYAP